MLIFKWGKKRGRGGKNKDVQFYESFTFDEVDYSLYDCVYMYKEGEPVPCIGKLTKIWETGEGMKKVKVQWFFRPWEILYYLKDAKVLENELFLASGDGIGVADLNPVEAVAGKCNVICISTDRRNPQPSAEEIQMADYVFYRIFDVDNYTISDQMDDKVGGLEVNFVFNRRGCIRTLDSPKLVYAEKIEDRNVFESNICEKKDESKDLKSPVSLVQAEKGMKKHAGKFCDLDPSNREKFYGSASSELNGVQGLGVLINDTTHRSTSATIAEDKLKSWLVKDSEGCRKDEKLCENSNPLDENMLKTSLSKDAPRSGDDDDDVGLKKNFESNGNLNALQGNVAKSKEKSNLGHDKFDEDKGGSGPAAERLQYSSTLKVKLPTRDELVKIAHDQGRVVMVHNLDPQCTSGEVERIIWHKFQEDCTARMADTAIHNPYTASARAFVVFKSRDVANRVVQELHEERFMSPNQTCLVASPIPPTRAHLVNDKDWRQIQGMQKDWKEAVSTSHYSTAVDWCLLQLQSDKWWGSLHEQQQTELKKLMENLKSKLTLSNRPLNPCG